jgi:hypothetical protein
MKSLFSKTCDDAAFQQEWLNRHGVCAVSVGDTLTMPDLSPFVHPTSWRVVVRAAEMHVWGQHALKRRMDTSEYMAYLYTKSSDVDVIHRVLRSAKLTYVEDVHGDMTFENCLVVGDDVLFIDPGHARGMKCRELDEGKILQSVMGWEHIRRGLPCPYDIGFPFSAATLAFFLSHMIRLIAHPEKHTPEAIDWARSMADWARRLL